MSLTSCLSLLLTLNIFYTLFWCFIVVMDQVNAGQIGAWPAMVGDNSNLLFNWYIGVVRVHV